MEDKQIFNEETNGKTNGTKRNFNNNNRRRRSRGMRRRNNFNRRVKKFGRQIVNPDVLGLTVGKSDSHSFGMIDKRYTQQLELLRGLKTYARPIYGDVNLELNFNSDRFNEIMERTLYRWIETIGFSEIRALKGVVGITANTSISETVSKISNFITHRTAVILDIVCDIESFPLFMEKQHVSSIMLPEFINDFLHLIVSAKRYHRFNQPEEGQIKFNLSKGKLLKDYKFIDGKGALELTKALYELSQLATQGKFCTAIEVNNFSKYNTPSPHLFNALPFKFDSKENKIRIKIGYTTTEKDLSLMLLTGVRYESTTLPKGAIDSISYDIDKDRLNGPLSNFFLNEYLQIPDVYTQPEINTPVKEMYDIEENDNINIGKIV